jgi:hypothetical protein
MEHGVFGQRFQRSFWINAKLSCRRSVPLGAGLKKQQSGPLRLQSPPSAFADTLIGRYADTASFLVAAPPREESCGLLRAGDELDGAQSDIPLRGFSIGTTLERFEEFHER